jgi:hypothetical protein
VEANCVTEVSEAHTASTTSPNEGTCHESLISVTFKKVVPPHAMEALGGGVGGESIAPTHS